MIDRRGRVRSYGSFGAYTVAARDLPKVCPSLLCSHQEVILKHLFVHLGWTHFAEHLC